METKFTKGKWVKNYKGTIGHIKAISEFHGGLTPTVARFDVLTPSIFDDEKEANAYLIAAAPEMYDMLESLREDYGFLTQVGKDIDKLLAKARGEL